MLATHGFEPHLLPSWTSLIIYKMMFTTNEMLLISYIVFTFLPLLNYYYTTFIELFIQFYQSIEPITNDILDSFISICANLILLLILFFRQLDNLLVLQNDVLDNAVTYNVLLWLRKLKLYYLNFKCLNFLMISCKIVLM